MSLTKASHVRARGRNVAGDPAAKFVYIDEMRGLAILMVIAVHYSQNFANPAIRLGGMIGQFGVQLFFVASAITLCVSADRHGREATPVRNFYIRRWFRIAPLYYLGILAYWAIYTVDGSAESYTLGNIAANLGFVHGLVPSANNSIVPGGWSIAVEMMFYLFFPLAFKAAECLWRRLGLAGIAILYSLALTGALLFQFTSFALNGNPIGNNSFAFFFIANQLPAFAAGMGWYFAVLREGRSLCAPPVGLACCLVGLTICGAILIESVDPLIAITPAIAALACLGLAEWLRSRKDGSALLADIGTFSFSLYILHFALIWWPVKMVVVRLHGNVLAEFALLVPLYVVSLAILLVVARMTRRLVEDPGNAMAGRLIRHMQARRELAGSL